MSTKQQNVAPSAASIEGLTRYEPILAGITGDEMVEMCASADGEFVRLEDVERLLATQSAKQGAQPSAWISIDDAIPDDGAVVMICGDKRHDEGKYQAVAKVLGGFFFDDDHEEDGEYINVTHWQPLPALPGAASQAAPEQANRVPADVRAALDRMCTPLDKSWLSGVTAQSDARCMQIIRRYIESTATPAAQVQADLSDDEITAAGAGSGQIDPGQVQTVADRIRGHAWETEGAAGAGSDQAPIPEAYRKVLAMPDGPDVVGPSVTVQDERARPINEQAEFDKKFPPATTDMHCDEYDALVELRGHQWQAWQAGLRAAHPVQDGEKDAERLDFLDSEPFVELAQYCSAGSKTQTVYVEVRVLRPNGIIEEIQEATAREAIDAAMAAAKTENVMGED